MCNEKNLLSFSPVLSSRCVTRRGEVSPALFQKLGKSALILRKNALIAVIPGLNFLFKVQFLKIPGEKTRDFYLWGLSFSCCRWLFIEVPKFQENSPALENSWLHDCQYHIFHYGHLVPQHLLVKLCFSQNVGYAR